MRIEGGEHHATVLKSRAPRGVPPSVCRRRYSSAQSRADLRHSLAVVAEQLVGDGDRINQRVVRESPPREVAGTLGECTKNELLARLHGRDEPGHLAGERSDGMRMDALAIDRARHLDDSLRGELRDEE